LEECKLEQNIIREELQAVVRSTLELLQDNREWEQRYTIYAAELQDNIETLKLARRSFRQWRPLYAYINISNAKSSSRTIGFELRYLGQTVADLLVGKQGLTLDTSEYDAKNRKHFGCLISLVRSPWNGVESSRFRAFFREADKVTNKGNEEHRIQSLLLTEFSGQDKVLPLIRPVTLANIRFPMPTPLAASNPDKLKYSGHSGGGIDILARSGKGRSTKLCVMELKDENKKKEPPIKALKQAVVYTVFIRELLRSGCGEEWWRLFGFGGPLPKALTLYAACVMPAKGDDDPPFEGIELALEEDRIALHHVYFHEQDNTIVKVDTSLVK
jgi:hypothetical protein